MISERIMIVLKIMGYTIKLIRKVIENGPLKLNFDYNGVLLIISDSDDMWYTSIVIIIRPTSGITNKCSSSCDGSKADGSIV